MEVRVQDELAVFGLEQYHALSESCVIRKQFSAKRVINQSPVNL